MYLSSHHRGNNTHRKTLPWGMCAGIQPVPGPEGLQGSDKQQNRVSIGAINGDYSPVWCWEPWGAACSMERGALTLLNDLLGLLPDPGIAQESPLPLFADLALQVVLLWNLSVHQCVHNMKQ